jgi:metallo-beta-lactamase family protein
MKSIAFIGAAGEVTGSGYVVTADDMNQVLVDLGMFQGTEEQVKQNYGTLDFDASALQGVFLSHAHLDHSGRLPLLVYEGFKGKIYMTEPTSLLIQVILTDSARIAEMDVTKRPIYTSREVYKVLNMIELVEYNQEISVGSFQAVFRDAGHILGSASIELTDTSTEKRQTAVFSGDLGNTPQELVKPTQYIEKADFVVMESTYGDSSHPDENATQIIQEEINRIEEIGGVLLIPAFALERTQEVLHILHHLKKDKKIDIQTAVYLDSPMGITATNIYYDFPDYWNEEMQRHTDDPFSFPGLFITDDVRDSREISRKPNPKVILAGSGMMSGGRIMKHAKLYLPSERTRVLFVGYQGEDTMGREILDGAKNVFIDKTSIPVRAAIREIKILSSHADQPRLVTWLEKIKGVQKVFLTHGEQPQRETFSGLIKDKLEIRDVVLPVNGEEHNL